MNQTSKVIPFRGRNRAGPSTLNVNVLSPRKKNSELRSREYLTADEVEQLINAARSLGRHGHRDATLIMMAYRHGLRVGELVALRWDSLDLKQGSLHVNRLKNGTPSTHRVYGPELRALRRLQRDYPASPYVFSTERKGPLSTSTVRKVISRAGDKAGLRTLAAHPHMLRHSCGYYLANKGIYTRSIQAYLGHRNIQHTCTYTELSPNRFTAFWTD